MTEADVVLLIGRKLDYQIGYGSPAVFPNARFIRIADTPGELIDNRRGQPELLASPASRAGGHGRRPPATAKAGIDKAWADGLRKRHRERIAAAEIRETTGQTTGSDGKIHPRVIFDAVAATAPNRTTSRSRMAATC